jgi:hypothetical protein
MQNPIPLNARGWIYVAGLVIGAVLLVAPDVLTMAGMESWDAVFARMGGAVTALVSALGRSHLADPVPPVLEMDIEMEPEEG